MWDFCGNQVLIKHSGPNNNIICLGDGHVVEVDQISIEFSISSSSYNFSDALHMRSIMHCCWRGVRGCLNNFGGCYCKI